MKPSSNKDDQTVPKLYGSTTVAKDLKVDPSAPPAFQDDNKNAPASVPASVLEDTASNPRNYRAPAFQKIRRDENLNQDVDVEQRGSSSNNNSNSNDDDDEKVCRICLEEDSPETMIAPCRCKGSSKWVHRECLDEWRTNEHDRAFSKCTECLFEYYLQPVYEDDDDETDGNGGCGRGCSNQQRRRLHFCGMVSRDLCWGFLAQQAVVVLLGFLVWLIVVSNSDYNSDSDPGTSGPGLGLCYLLGWFAFLVGLGLYGLIVLYANGCDLKKAIPRVGPPSEAETEAHAVAGTPSGATSGAYEAAAASAPSRDGNQSDPMAQGYHYTRCEDDDYDDGYRDFSGNRRWQRNAEGPSVQYYRRARRRHRQYRRRWYDNDYDYYNDYYHRNRYSNYYYGPTYYPVYVYPTGNHCCCCCCCCDSHGPPVNAHALGGSGCCDCDLGGCLRVLHGHVRNSSGGGGSGSGNRSSGGRSNNRDNNNNNNSNDATHILLVVLLVVAIILAVIGFFVGVVVVVLAGQRIVARHVHLLQKRQLVREFRVLDLQEYDLDAPTATAPMEDEVYAGDDNDKVNQNLGLGVGTKHPPPSAPLLQEDDTTYLQSLGLMDRR
eukprot:CAMPEP_0172383792 /NCGR_PEP_ID=MMETSP1061-20121228/1600_1 /TAXON_ID=37318 /ORGANISM="Pseudo-nitzschia pungens, Strain cf. pungens" /LENGTH=602 /DNA_ID=CAMNT_0013112139 /DNA_START=455 /DNA_END=2263 /DNA_ORIENTATION=+